MARILIIDDALEFGRFLRTALLTMDPGLSVSVVPSAEEGLLEITRQKPHLLVVDFRLPGMSGADLVRKVKARLPKIKMILVSGLAEIELPVVAAEAGAVAYFRKPMVISEFLDTVQSLLADIPGEEGKVPAKPAAAAVRPEPENAVPPARLTDLLTGLRQRLGALCVLVVDERGKITAQAGEFPAPDFEHHWAPGVISALAAQMPLGRQLNPAAPEMVTVLQGKDFHLAATAAGSYACVAALTAGRNALRLAIAVEELLNARHDLTASLEAAGSTTVPAVQTPPVPTLEQILAVEELVEEPAASTQDFEALFGSEPAALQNADDFWESNTAATARSDAAGPEMLSYEDARRLGLAPDEKENNQ